MAAVALEFSEKLTSEKKEAYVNMPDHKSGGQEAIFQALQGYRSPGRAPQGLETEKKCQFPLLFP